jgi:hypothetical protein
MITSKQIDAIYKLYTQVVSTHGDEAFDINGNKIEYDLAAINSYINANKYKELRAAEYPSIADQLDTIYHEGIDAWKEQINTIKEKYPKG